MARVDNLENFLTDVAGAIKTKKGTTDKIPAANFDTEIASIETGIDTSDATATADDLALNKTAYVNGIKLEGNVDTIASGSMTSGRFIENSPYLAVRGARDLLLRAGGAIQITEEQIADKGNITPEKIVKGNTIFGVEGTAESGGSTSRVKLFNTAAEMNSSTGNVEGDLALVYRNEQQNMTADMEVTAITFPETVTLPTAFTGDAYGELRSVDSSVMFNGDCMLDKNSFGFYSFSDTGMIRASYTSEDGITYTRTSLRGDSGDLDNPVALPTAVKGDANEWNDNFGYFMQIGTNVLEGIYIYKNNSWELASTQLTAASDYVYKQLLFYGKNGIESGTLGIPDNSFVDTTAKVYNEIQNQYDNMEPRILTDDDKTIDKNIDFIPVKRDGTPLLDTSKVTDMSYMFGACKNLMTIPKLNTSNATNMAQMFDDCTNLTTIPLLDTSKVTNMNYMFHNCTNLTTIPELDTSSVTDMTYMFSGCTNLTKIPLLNTSSATNMSDMFSNCRNLITIPELNTSSTTDTSSMFAGCLSLTTIPLLDTSKVTKMSSMFNGCTNLTTIPELDTSNATNMSYMLRGCTNLTTIPELDTSSATNMAQIFADCSSLTTIPLLDTSKVTDMTSMFYGCTNLTTIPELNTSSATNMNFMFYSCTNLTTIPELDTSTATNMVNMFAGCSSLSNDSLNIIMQMCINATSYTNTKTLKYIGLSSEQADRCKTLSNYSAFTSAGWTTGY